MLCCRFSLGLRVDASVYGDFAFAYAVLLIRIRGCLNGHCCRRGWGLGGHSRCGWLRCGCPTTALQCAAARVVRHFDSVCAVFGKFFCGVSATLRD